MTHALDRHYSSLEKNLRLVEAGGFGALVVPNGNATTGVHRWFSIKESFSADLLETLLWYLGLQERRGLRVLDCFAGAGTTVVSAMEDGSARPGRIGRVGAIEQNPFLHLVVRAKAGAFSSDKAQLRRFRDDVAFGPLPGAVDELPELSAFHEPAYFPGERLRRLLGYRDVVRLAALVQPLEDAALVALAGCVEPISRLRKDGRALRYEKDKVVATDARAVYVRALDRVLRDLDGSSPVKATVVHGDGRQPDKAFRGQFDLVVFSPPYPNNIDYTEVYKLEAWFLGFYESQKDFRAQRLRTVRSHPSVKFAERSFASELGLADAFNGVVDPILDAVPSDRYEHQRQRMVRGYFDDMLRTLAGVRRRLAEGGTVAVVVGNSLHGHAGQTLLVAADVVIAELGRLVGLDPVAILVARRPVRRTVNQPRLRESVVLLRPSRA
jgi:16S rRNA G966 N2-methylase RsmD